MIANSSDNCASPAAIRRRGPQFVATRLRPVRGRG
jgi:hypothetical protein